MSDKPTIIAKPAETPKQSQQPVKVRIGDALQPWPVKVRIGDALLPW